MNLAQGQWWNYCRQDYETLVAHWQPKKLLWEEQENITMTHMRHVEMRAAIPCPNCKLSQVHLSPSMVMVIFTVLCYTSRYKSTQVNSQAQSCQSNKDQLKSKSGHAGNPVLPLACLSLSPSFTLHFHFPLNLSFSLPFVIQIWRSRMETPLPHSIDSSTLFSCSNVCICLTWSIGLLEVN